MIRKVKSRILDYTPGQRDGHLGFFHVDQGGSEASFPWQSPGQQSSVPPKSVGISITKARMVLEREELLLRDHVVLQGILDHGGQDSNWQHCPSSHN